MDDDYGYEYDEGSDIDNWEAEQVFQDHEGEEPEEGVGYCRGCDDWNDLIDGLCMECEQADPCDSCGAPFDDSCMGCPEYARKASKADPGGVYNAAGECIGRTDEPILY